MPVVAFTAIFKCTAVAGLYFYPWQPNYYNATLPPLDNVSCTISTVNLDTCEDIYQAQDTAAALFLLRLVDKTLAFA